MRGIWLSFCLILATVAAFAQAPEHPPLEQLLSLKELYDYQRKSKYKDHIKVFEQALKRFSKQLSQQVDNKQVEQMLVTLDDVRSLAYYVLEEDLPEKKKDRKAGEVRKLEIRIRKLLEDIQDAKTLAPYEYHVEFDETLQDLGKLRSQLLKQMFGTAATGGQQSSSSRQGSMDLVGMGFAGPAAVPQDDEIRYSYEITGDQFTEAEYEKVRNNQDLKRRVNVFLDIAEARLKEIHRRMNNLEWEEKDPNPLEFYTYEQMVHAYTRALDSAMINIDEKVKYKLAKEKDIKKTLEKLNEKIMEFTPQLAPIKELAIKNKDEILYREVLAAEKTSEIARKGTLYGLGAPVQ